MDKTLYIFNTEHDIALSNGDPNFVPPSMAVRFGEDSAVLPMWLSADIKSNPVIIIPKHKEISEYKENIRFLSANIYIEFEDKSRQWLIEYLDNLCISYPIPQLTDNISNIDIEKIVTWGWDEAICQKLRKQGIDESLFPTKQELEYIKSLSHRRIALKGQKFINSRIASHIKLSSPSTEIHSLEEATNYLDKNKNIVLKSPLSGSGRGIRWCKDVFSHSDIGWIRNTISKIGSIMGEERLEIVKDFATEFYIDKFGEIEFCGYSLFETKNGAYIANVLASDQKILEILSRYISLETLQEIVELQMEFIKTEFSNKYRGYVGIDMAIYIDENQEYSIAPIIEINVRMTMGLLARNIHDRYIYKAKTPLPDPLGLMFESSASN